MNNQILTKPRIVDTRDIKSDEDIQHEFEDIRLSSVWIADSSSMAMLSKLSGKRQNNQSLLVLDPIGRFDKDYFYALFSQVVLGADGATLLAPSELTEILASPNSEDYFIGGTVNLNIRSIIFYRGNLESLVVPLAWFKAGPNSPQPDPEDFEIIDFGHTVRLGQFEAATEAILYEFDPDFRRRERKRRFDGDESFGGSLRRLRRQRGLKRGDFLPLSSKAVARIERGEVETPQATTLKILSQRLGVDVEDIATY